MFGKYKRATIRADKLQLENMRLIEAMRQIEWRLAMCRNMAVDVNIAHAVATRALESNGGPYPDTSANYQRWKAKRDANRR